MIDYFILILRYTNSLMWLALRPTSRWGQVNWVLTVSVSTSWNRYTLRWIKPTNPTLEASQQTTVLPGHLYMQIQNVSLYLITCDNLFLQNCCRKILLFHRIHLSQMFEYYWMNEYILSVVRRKNIHSVSNTSPRKLIEQPRFCFFEKI